METARDVSIIILAVFAIIQAIAISALAIVTLILVRTIQRKIVPVLDRVPPLMDRLTPIVESIPPIIETAQRSAHSLERAARQVEVTAAFSSEKAVKPVIAIASFLAGARATLKAIVAIVTGGRIYG
ncbi:MAG: hypothetical protein RMM58_05070 [Chloroflexota bacterium]|nr:hypothetical protein [Dehalococcoidia bacterium]MDW8253235.1 hypothetical protein [Chloroflexota bacterium]